MFDLPYDPADYEGGYDFPPPEYPDLDTYSFVDFKANPLQDDSPIIGVWYVPEKLVSADLDPIDIINNIKAILDGMGDAYTSIDGLPNGYERRGIFMTAGEASSYWREKLKFKLGGTSYDPVDKVWFVWFVPSP